MKIQLDIFNRSIEFPLVSTTTASNIGIVAKRAALQQHTEFQKWHVFRPSFSSSRGPQTHRGQHSLGQHTDEYLMSHSLTRSCQPMTEEIVSEFMNETWRHHNVIPLLSQQCLWAASFVCPYLLGMKLQNNERHTFAQMIIFLLSFCFCCFLQPWAQFNNRRH